jgi:xanthine dehydrogenase YagS FAD-binding subunit
VSAQAVTPETAAAVGAAAIAAAKPLSMNAYKVGLTQTVVKRALLAAVGNRYWEA